MRSIQDELINRTLTDNQIRKIALVEIEKMLEYASELLISSEDQAALCDDISSLLGENTPCAGLGSSIITINTLADKILS